LYFNVRVLNLFLFLIAACLVSGCERATKARVKGGATPVFVLAGSGNLSRFSLYLISPPDFKLGRTVDSLSSDSFFTEPAQWSVEAPDWRHGSPVEDLIDLTYGVVPPGYKQRVPADGSAPAAIIPGRTYFFEFVTTNAPGVSGAFQVINGKPEPVHGVGLPCLQLRDGKEVTVPCIDPR
jgi:hypothetical protein